MCFKIWNAILLFTGHSRLKWLKRLRWTLKSFSLTPKSVVLFISTQSTFKCNLCEAFNFSILAYNQVYSTNVWKLFPFPQKRFLCLWLWQLFYIENWAKPGKTAFHEKANLNNNSTKSTFFTTVLSWCKLNPSFSKIFSSFLVLRANFFLSKFN